MQTVSCTPEPSALALPVRARESDANSRRSSVYWHVNSYRPPRSSPMRMTWCVSALIQAEPSRKSPSPLTQPLRCSNNSEARTFAEPQPESFKCGSLAVRTAFSGSGVMGRPRVPKSASENQKDPGSQQRFLGWEQPCPCETLKPTSGRARLQPQFGRLSVRARARICQMIGSCRQCALGAHA